MTGPDPAAPGSVSPPLLQDWRAVALRAAICAAIGAVTGLGFVLPVATYLRTIGRPGANVWLVASAVVAIVVVRSLGRVLRRVLDATRADWRFPLLGLYALLAMGVLAALVLGKSLTPPG